MGNGKYNDLHEHLELLDKKGLLIRVTKEINKDTELHPLVRWQYRGGITEENRKAFFFENVTNTKGIKFDMPVVVGALAANPEIYCTGVGCKREDLGEIWRKAFEAPIGCSMQDKGPVQDVVITGDELEKVGNGTDRFPVPISTPGFDNAPYTTCSHWISKDIETGIPNMGNYRGQLKGPRKVGMFPSGLGQDIMVHWESAKQRGFLSRWPSSLAPPPSSLTLQSKRYPMVWTK